MPDTTEETPKGVPGRPTDCTPEITAEFVRYFAGGNYAVTVCNLLGISEPTFYNWMAWGQKGNDAPGLHPDAFRTFFKSVTKAVAQAEVAAVAAVQLAGRDRPVVLDEDGNEVPMVKGEWQATMTFLERRHRTRWARPQRVMIGGDDDAPPVEVKYTTLSDFELADIVAKGREKNGDVNGSSSGTDDGAEGEPAS